MCFDKNEKGFGHGRHARQIEENKEQTTGQAEATDKEWILFLPAYRLQRRSKRVFAENTEL